MSSCQFCESTNVEFQCEKCSSGFCINHQLTTETWECKKHDIQFSKAKAVDHKYKCSIIESSTCPECNSVLSLERLSSGQYYLECTSCSWNSYSKTPGVFYPAKETLAKESVRYGLIKRFNPCFRKLKHIVGKEICPKCFLELLKRGPIVNFSTIMNSFNITADQLVKFINMFLEEEKIYGIIDQPHQMFYYISPEIKDKLLSKFNDEGIVDLSDLTTFLDMSSETVLQVIYKIIGKFQIKGSFSTDKKKYYTQQYISDNVFNTIKEKGRISLTELSNKFNLPREMVKSYCVNLMRTNKDYAFFADKGNQIINANQIVKEIKDYAKQVGLFRLNKLAEKLKVAVELARRSLHQMIKTGEIKGIFTQRREFMTSRHLETKIKELAKAYRNLPLRDIANRLGVTESSIEENLARIIGRGDIDGYIDSQKRLFVAYSVSMETPKTAKTKQPAATQTVEDKVEVVRDYDFIGGQLHFKVAVRNFTEMAIHNVKVVLDVPTSYKVKVPLINIPVIEKGNSRGVDFYLEPKECGISSLGGTVIYKNAKGEQRTIHIRKKEVQIKCPLVCTSLSTIEDCQLSIQSLPNDARAFLIADLDPRLAYRAAIRTLKNFETSMVTSFEGADSDKNYEAEAWFCSEAKITGGRIITRVYVSEMSQSLEVRVWCANPGQLTGFLAKIIEILFEEINIIRKIKYEEREKTLDVMAITQNLAEISDYCMLRWKGQNIRMKLQDTFVRLRKILGDSNPILGRIEYWLTDLNKYDKDQNINEEEADKLSNDVENFKNVLARTLRL
jgi:DNA-binding Lrp family transcriptional regulator